MTVTDHPSAGGGRCDTARVPLTFPNNSLDNNDSNKKDDPPPPRPSLNTNITNMMSVMSRIQSTSLLVSYWRYKESQRPGGGLLLSSNVPSTDGLIVDCLLSDNQRRIFDDSPILTKGIDALALRTRFIDDWLLMSSSSSSISSLSGHIDDPTVQHQMDHKDHNDDDDDLCSTINPVVVNLGAGMDARPYRLKGLAKRTKYIEIDSDVSLLELKYFILETRSPKPTTTTTTTTTMTVDDVDPTDGHQLKTKVLSSRLSSSSLDGNKDNNTSPVESSLKPFCDITRIGADLSDVQSTLQSLHDVGLTVFQPFTDRTADEMESVDWIAEGLFAYLDPSQHQPLLRVAHDNSGPTSRMVLTVLDPTGVDNFHSMGFEIPWKQLVPVQEIVRQAIDVGWKQATVIPFEDLFERYQRSPVTDLTGYVLVTLSKK